MSKTAIINESQVLLIEELLANAGWLDDPRETLAEVRFWNGEEAARAKMAEVNGLIAIINDVTGKDIKLIE